MAKAYILVEVTIPDPAAYAASGYMAMAEACVAKAGGRFLVRGGDPVAMEGALSGTRIVILEFPDRAAAVRFHGGADYAPALALRNSLSTARAVLLDEYGG